MTRAFTPDQSRRERFQRAPDDVIVELPTEIDGDAVRLEIEQRVRALLLTAR